MGETLSYKEILEVSKRQKEKAKKEMEALGIRTCAYEVKDQPIEK